MEMDSYLLLVLVTSALVGAGIGTGFAVQLRWPHSKKILGALVGAIIAATVGVSTAKLSREANARTATEVCKLIKPAALTAYGLEVCK